MKSIGYLYSIGAAVTWGIVYNIDQRILAQLSPINLLFIDAILTLLVLSPIFIFHRSSIHEIANISGKELALIIISLVFGILANFLIFSGIRILGADTASALEIAYPFFVVVFGYLIFQESITVPFAVGAVLVLMGSFIIVKFS